ncbi:MAG TPA: carbohydrate ABC transporter permease [Symbiobacteriaceae bacterium]|jgi:raffinose/stachyose/melibiose transport system permease protein|nr:carbohydrate ABC transporter permease [Symbiobacteriaceae bacterium]
MARKRLGLLLMEVATAILFIIMFSPFYIVVANAFKNRFTVLTEVLSLPKDWSQVAVNLKAVMNSPNLQFWSSATSSVIITVLSLLVISLFSSMGAWVLVRSKSKASQWIFMMYVAAMVVPFQVVMLPLVAWMRMIHDITGLQVLRTYGGMIFAYLGFGSSLSIFLYHGFIKGIPLELEQAAAIDGCSRWQVFFRIIRPMLKPITVTVLILNGIWIWNDYLLPLLMLGTGNEIQTLPVAIASFVGSFVKQWELIMLALLLAIIPVVIFYLFAQKHIIKGMVEGSLKG